MNTEKIKKLTGLFSAWYKNAKIPAKCGVITFFLCVIYFVFSFLLLLFQKDTATPDTVALAYAQAMTDRFNEEYHYDKWDRRFPKLFASTVKNRPSLSNPSSRRRLTDETPETFILNAIKNPKPKPPWPTYRIGEEPVRKATLQKNRKPGEFSYTRSILFIRPKDKSPHAEKRYIEHVLYIRKIGHDYKIYRIWKNYGTRTFLHRKIQD